MSSGSRMPAHPGEDAKPSGQLAPAGLAHQEERPTCNRQAAGSNPAAGSMGTGVIGSPIGFGPVSARPSRASPAQCSEPRQPEDSR